MAMIKNLPFFFIVYFIFFFFKAHATDCPQPTLSAEEEELANELAQFNCQKLSQTVCDKKHSSTGNVSEVQYQMTLREMHRPEFKNRITGYLASAISVEPALDQVTKEKFNGIAEEIKFVFEMEDGMEMGLSEKELDYLRALRILSCGLSNQVPNALALFVGNRKIVMVCPMATKKILANMTGEVNAENLADQFSFLIGHEIGHFLYRGNEKKYENLRECLVDHPTHEMLQSARTLNPFKLLFGELKVGPHMNEIAADYWGHRVAGQMLKSTSNLKFLVNNYHFMCEIGAHDDGEHPNLSYRLDFLAGAERNISSGIYCPAKKGCNL